MFVNTYYDPTTKRLVMTADPLPQPHFDNGAISNSITSSINTDRFFEQNLASSEFVQNSAKTLPAPFLGSYERPGDEGATHFDSTFSPIMSMQTQFRQGQDVATPSSASLYEQLQHHDNNVSGSHYAPATQSSMFEDWRSNKAEVELLGGLQGTNNIYSMYSLPYEPFNGDQTLLVIEKTKLVDLKEATPSVPSAVALDSSDKEAESRVTNTSVVATNDDDENKLLGSNDSGLSLFPETILPVVTVANFGSIFGETKSPISVFSDDDSDSVATGGDLMNGEEQEAQYNGRRKRKVSLAEDDDSSESEENVSVPSTKRRKSVVAKPIKQQQRQRKNKIDEEDTSSGSDDKPFKCPHCGHASKRRYNLNTHMKTHNKERVKAFPCGRCAKAFDRKHDRDRHIENVHEGKRKYACEECGTKFSRSDALERHMERHRESV